MNKLITTIGALVISTSAMANYKLECTGVISLTNGEMVQVGRHNENYLALAMGDGIAFMKQEFYQTYAENDLFHIVQAELEDGLLIMQHELDRGTSNTLIYNMEEQVISDIMRVNGSTYIFQAYCEPVKLGSS